MESLLPSPETTLAVILGASEFPKQPNLTGSKSFLKSAQDFKTYLLDQSGLGLPVENVLDLFDCDDAAPEIDERVVTFLEGRQKNLVEQNKRARDLILYYVGHGGFSSPGDEYFLAIRKTRIHNEGASSYAIKMLANTLRENAINLRRYLILDSCFSATAYASFQSAPLEVAKRQTLEELPAKGTALLCAAGPKDPAKALPDQTLTMFSGAFLEALQSGDSHNPGRLSFWEVSELTRVLIKEKFPDNAVRPEMLSPDQKLGNLAMIPFFPNPMSGGDISGGGGDSMGPIPWPVADPVYIWPLADRKPEFALFEKMITGQSKRRILLLQGLTNTGKTACISELLAYAKHLKIAGTSLDFKGTPSLNDLFDMLRLDLGSGILRRAIHASGPARFIELISDLQQLTAPLVLVFDTYQQASAEAQLWLEDKFLPRLDRAPGVVTIIGGQTVPPHDRYAALTELRVLEPIKRVQDWLEYTRRKWESTEVNVDHVKALTLGARGDPGQVSALLETMMLGLKEESGD
jgi:hypothetical protein